MPPLPATGRNWRWSGRIGPADGAPALWPAAASSQWLHGTVTAATIERYGSLTGYGAPTNWTEIELIWETLERDLACVEEQVRWFRDVWRRSDLGESPDSIQPGSLEALTRTHHGADIGHDGVVTGSGSELRDLRSSDDRAAGIRNWVYWVERSQIQGSGQPQRGADPCRRSASRSAFRPVRSLVLTSATITTDGHIRLRVRRLGLDDPDELSFASPFDFRAVNAALPGRRYSGAEAPGYQRRIQETLIELCDATRGRALVLFTSHAALQATYKAIQGPARGCRLFLAQRTRWQPPSVGRSPAEYA